MNNENFITGRGWIYLSTCSCKPAWRSFTNPAYPGYVIRLFGNQFNIRQGQNALQMRDLTQQYGDITQTYENYFNGEN